MRRSRVLAAAAALVALAGCSSLPTSGPVVAGAAIAEQPQQVISVVAAPPEGGEDEQAIVQGFVEAMKSYQPGYSTAQSYLTAAAASAWDPTSGTQVYDSSKIAIDKAADGLVSVSFPLVATVGSDSTYTPVRPATNQQLSVPLQRVDGQWRISVPPTGLLVSESDFTREFSFADVYFPSPAGDTLIPDQVVVPPSNPISPTRPTALVKALLDGPTSWLKPAVQTAFPQGTQLALPGVVVENAQARIELNDAARSATTQARELMAAQLAITLEQVPGISSLTVRAGGVPFVIPNAPSGVFPISQFKGFDPSAPTRASTVYGTNKGAVLSVAGEGTKPVSGPFGTGTPAVRSVGVNLSSARLAAVAADGRSLLLANFSAGQPVATAYVGSDLSNPTWDRSGVVWVADRRPGAGDVPGSGLVGIDGSAAPVVIDVPELAGATVETVRISPDGVRLLMVVLRNGHREVQIGLLRRGADGDQPLDGVKLVGLRTVPVGLADVRGASWTSQTTLAVLGSSTEGGTPEPFLVDLNGTNLRSQGNVGDATSIAAAPGLPIVVATQARKLYRQNTLSSWVVVGDGNDPTYAG